METRGYTVMCPATQTWNQSRSQIEAGTPEQSRSQNDAGTRNQDRSVPESPYLQAAKPAAFRYRLMLPLFLLILFAGGCELFQVSFDDAHPYDPSLPGYIPSPPVELTISKYAVNPRDIEIRWEIQSIGHDGFLIEKSIGSVQSFGEFARLAPNRNSFRDNTRNLAPDIWYRVTSYIERDGELLRHLTDPLHMGYGDFISVEMAWISESSPSIYRFGVNWRDNIDASAREGYDILAIRDDGHEHLLGNFRPGIRNEYTYQASYGGPDAERYRSIRIDAYYTDIGEKRLYSSIQAELDIQY